MNNKQIEILIDFLKNKQVITNLEKDILDTVNEIVSQPFDRKSAEKKIIENNLKYPEVFTTICTMPENVLLPFSQVNDMDIIKNLQKQLMLLCGKEEEKQKWTN